MNKELLYATMVAIILSVMAAGCVDNSLEQDVESQYTDGRIAFKQKIGNMTRGTTQAQDAGHYEFGVWAYKGAEANKQYPSGDVMNDYLVAYGSNSYYASLAANSDTYGVDAGGAGETVPGDGISSWFYDGLGTDEGFHKERTSPDAHIVPSVNKQIIKYWDGGHDYHNFFAYAPYYGHQAGDVPSVSLSEVANQNVLTYSSLSTFYTDPVEQTSVVNTTWTGTYAPLTRDSYNSEILNAYEGIYAAQSIAKANYGKDVPLTFKHLNAKIRIAFYEAIDGYKVELLDLVPETEAGHIANMDIPQTTALTADKNLIPSSGAYEGIALSPATEQQAIVTNQKESALVDPGASIPLPSYYTKAKTIATNVKQTGGVTDDATISLGSGSGDYAYTNKNLRFQKPSGNISEIGGAGATVLPTIYYALPNHDGTNYLTKTYDADYTTQHVAENTGYTLHVTYKLIPQDGAEPDIVYDARVWVAPEFCRWQAGKQYTYVFKITSFTNGTTNPYISSDGMFSDGDTNQPYIDPDDPRVPSTMALIPIVFDNVFVSDYESQADIPAEIYNVLNWPLITYSGTDYKYCSILMTPAEYIQAIGSNPYTPPTTPLDATRFDGETYKFCIGTEMMFAADNATTAPMSGASIYSSGTFASVKDEHDNDVSTEAKDFWNTTYGSASVDVPAYTMHIWTDKTGVNAEKYTATPNDPSKVTVKTKIMRMQTTTTYAGYCYKIETKNYNNGITITRYYKTDDTEIIKDDYDVLVAAADAASITPTTGLAYDFGYTYAVDKDGYAVSHAAAGSTPTKAYGLVKHE